MGEEIIEDIQLPGRGLNATLNDINRTMAEGFAKVTAEMSKKVDREEFKPLVGRVEVLEQSQHDKDIIAAALAAHKETSKLSRKAKWGIIAAAFSICASWVIAVFSIIHP